MCLLRNEAQNVSTSTLKLVFVRLIFIIQVHIIARAPGLTSGLQGSVNVHRSALLLVPQWQCINSFVFYIMWFVLVHVYSLAMKTQHPNVHHYLKDILNILSQRILVMLWIQKTDTILALLDLTWNVWKFIRMRTFQP